MEIRDGDTVELYNGEICEVELVFSDDPFPFALTDKHDGGLSCYCNSAGVSRGLTKSNGLGFNVKRVIEKAIKTTEKQMTESTIYTSEDLLKFFEETTEQMVSVARAKNHDYSGAAKDAFANFARVEDLGICTTEQGFLTRMTDKLCRIASFVKKGELKVKDESVEDTLLDLANYSILMMAYIKSKKDK